MGSETKKYHFCVLFAWTTPIAIFHQKYEKVLIQIQDPEFVTTNNKNAIETPFLAISSPQKAMIGINKGL